MFSRILVPLDGSPLAEQAVPVAAHIARAAGGGVVLVRVLTPIAVGGYEPGYAPYVGPSPEMLERETIDTGAYLTRVAGWPVLSGLAVETSVVAGVTAPAILADAEQLRADLVVLTTHGRTGLSRWALGSVAQHLARQATVPVLVLRPQSVAPDKSGADAAPTLAPRAGRVLVPLDGSLLAEAALAPAVALAAALASPAPGELHLLMIVDRFVGAITAAPESLMAAGAEGYLSRVAERLEREYASAVRVTWSASIDSDIAAAILRVAAQGATGVDATYADADPTSLGSLVARADVIAMATHGRSGFARWALGSVTDRVLLGATLPLLVVRPRQVSAEASQLLEQRA